MKNDFERLLQNAEEHSQGVADPQEITRRKNPPLRSNKSADLRDFIQMISQVVSKTMKDQGVKFIPDEGRRIVVDPSFTIEHPCITYKVISRKTGTELKPRARETIKEESYDQKEGRQGTIYGQKFKCTVQFDIIASEYSTADQVMYNFEELILTYNYFFKKNGVAEILFEEHFTDENYDLYRQNVSVRSLRYYVEVEKLTVIFDSEFEDVDIQ